MKHNPWPMLTTVAQQAADQAARGLQTLMQSLEQAREQRDLLQSYRQDYARRMQQAGARGVTAANYHNFCCFLQTLDDAIVQQNAHICQLETQSEQGRAQWLTQQRKLNAYETLQQRHAHRLRTLHLRQEQRLHDEISVRRHASH